MTLVYVFQICSTLLGAAAGEQLPALPTPQQQLATTSVVDWGDEGPPSPADAPEQNDQPSASMDLREVYGIDESLLRSVVDRMPLDVNEHEVLYRILFRLPQIPSEVVERWCRRDIAWPQLWDDPQAYRGEFVFGSGRVTKLEVESLIPELIERFGFEHYYRLHIQPAQGDSQLVVYARFVPRVWTEAAASGSGMNEPASFCGMFLKAGDPSGPAPHLILAASRVAWHPDQVSQRFGIDVDHLLLSELGMDVGLLDQVKDRRRIVQEDRECFYQLLAAMSNLRPAHLRDRHVGQIPVPELLHNPEPLRGKMFAVHGTALRAIRIQVDDADVRARFQMDHYYQLDVFVPLERPIELVENQTDSQGKLFASYPVTVCVRHLPQGMPQGEDIHEEVRVNAFFVKLWTYRTQFMNTPQPSPLLIGRAPNWIRRQAATNSAAGWLLGALLVAILVAVWYAIWHSRRDDRRLKRSFASNRYRASGDQTSDRPDGVVGDSTGS